MDRPDPELDALLRRARPTPDPAWVRVTGEQLLPPARAGRRTTAMLAAAIGLAVVVLTLVLAAAGGGPFGGDEPVQAGDRCRSVTVTRVRTVPRVVTRGGEQVIVTRREPVRVAGRRCR